MAYVSQDTKAKLAPTIKAILKKYGVKGSLSIRNHMSLVLTLKSGKIDFFESYNRLGKVIAERVGRQHHDETKYIQVNECWFHEHFEGTAKDFLAEIVDAMKGPDFFNNDDAQTDYFNRSHYIDINVGKWDKPYITE